MNHVLAERLALERVRDFRRRADTDACLRAAGHPFLGLRLPRRRGSAAPTPDPRPDLACSGAPACSCG